MKVVGGKTATKRKICDCVVCFLNERTRASSFNCRRVAIIFVLSTFPLHVRLRFIGPAAAFFQPAGMPLYQIDGSIDGFPSILMHLQLDPALSQSSEI
jgi:hypothetical protein